MSYESNNPGRGFGANVGNPNGGVGGTNATGRSGAPGGGGGYTFRSYRSAPATSGNWNTGGHVTGFGSQASGIRSPASPAGFTGHQPRGQPAPAMPIPAVPLPSSYPLPGQVTDVYSATPTSMDPGIVAHMLRSLNTRDPLAGFRNPNGNYSAQYNGGGTGKSFTGAGQGKAGVTGGGQGGGGGSGW